MYIQARQDFWWRRCNVENNYAEDNQELKLQVSISTASTTTISSKKRKKEEEGRGRTRLLVYTALYVAFRWKTDLEDRSDQYSSIPAHKYWRRWWTRWDPEPLWRPCVWTSMQPTEMETYISSTFVDSRQMSATHSFQWHYGMPHTQIIAKLQEDILKVRPKSCILDQLRRLPRKQSDADIDATTSPRSPKPHHKMELLHKLLTLWSESQMTP